jgi:hypothetical protein
MGVPEADQRHAFLMFLLADMDMPQGG